jgi:hypothetical protein
MVIMLGPLAMAGIVTTANMTLLRLLLRYFEAFLTPESVNPLKTDKPTLPPKLNRYPTIAIPGVLHMQGKQIINNRLILIWQFRLVPLRTSRLLQYFTGLTLGYSQLTANLINYLSSPGRD